jgi:DNA-binding CsgD family transcriptional regulator
MRKEQKPTSDIEVNDIDAVTSEAVHIAREMKLPLTMERGAPCVELHSSEILCNLNVRLERLAEELEIREMELAEARGTIKVLLRQREIDREEFKQTMIDTVNQMVRPFLDKLAQRKLGPEERSLVAVVQQNLDDLATPPPALASPQPGLFSPTETQVIHLVRQGKTSKDIAVLMGVAQSTIDFHRHNIRRKLGLSNTRHNLRSYLTADGGSIR